MNLSKTIILATIFSFAVAGAWLPGAAAAGMEQKRDAPQQANPTPKEQAGPRPSVSHSRKSVKAHHREVPPNPQPKFHGCGRMGQPPCPHPVLNPVFVCTARYNSCVSSGANGTGPAAGCGPDPANPASVPGCIKQVCGIVQNNCLANGGK